MSGSEKERAIMMTPLSFFFARAPISSHSFAAVTKLEAYQYTLYNGITRPSSTKHSTHQSEEHLREIDIHIVLYY